MALMTMASLFDKAGLNWEKMVVGEFMDVTEKNIKIRSFNHKSNKIEMNLIESLVFKGYQSIFNVIEERSKKVLLRAAKDHKIYDHSIDEYILLSEVKKGVALRSDGTKVVFVVEDSGENLPVVDMQVREVSNYFTNGILSHNTGGNALRFFSAVRMTTRSGDRIEDKQNGQTGMISKVKTIKNKVAPPFRTCDMKIIFGEGYKIEEEYVQAFVKYGIIKKSGGWYTVGMSISAGGQAPEPIKVQGEEKVMEWLKTNPEIYSEYKERLKLELSRKTSAVIVEDTEDEESKIAAEQEILEKEVLNEDDNSQTSLAKMAIDS